MITIIHGDNISESRKYFLELRQKQMNSIGLDENNTSITNLVQNIEGSSLFGNSKVIFIEGLLTNLKKTNKESKEILDFITKNSKSGVFVLWESKEIPKRELFLFKDSIVKVFKLPKNIFLFLDNLKPNNSKNLLNLFHQALDNGIKEELILFMLQRQVRILLALCHPEASAEGSSEILRFAQNDNGTIDEVSRLAPWQMNKLEKQTMLFSEFKLKKIYKKLYEIEIGQKTGTLSLSLTQSIDFLLLEI